jgi:hypothetical protein
MREKHGKEIILNLVSLLNKLGGIRADSNSLFTAVKDKNVQMIKQFLAQGADVTPEILGLAAWGVTKTEDKSKWVVKREAKTGNGDESIFKMLVEKADQKVRNKAYRKIATTKFKKVDKKKVMGLLNPSGITKVFKIVSYFFPPKF